MSLRDELKSRQIVGEVFEKKIPRYGYFVDKQSHERCFGQVGLVDQQANIQSELSTCDYSLLMQNLTTSMNDFDFDEFVDSLPSYDVSDPLSLVAAQEQFEISYQNLPKEVKAKYENNPRKFAVAIIDGKLADIVASWKNAEQAFEDNSRADTSTDPKTMAKQLEQMRVELEKLRDVRDGGNSVDAGGKSAEENKGDDK